MISSAMINRETVPRVVAIDGPAGSGKSTVGREVARRLGFRYVDTGAMYRTVAVAALRDRIDPDDADRLAAVVDGIDVRPGRGSRPFRVNLRGEDVSSAVREPEVDALVPRVARHGKVRERMVALQRSLAGAEARAEHESDAPGGGIVMEGRDIGTVVFPRAPVKIFLDASANVRARRRSAEREPPARGGVAEAIERRDREDRTRNRSPLRPAEDAVIIDTTDLPFDGVVSKVMEAAESAFGKAN